MVERQRVDPADFRRARFRHFTPSPTRWGDCDRLGHVNNVLFVRYFETGRLDYMLKVLDIDTRAGLASSLILADIHVSFLAQIHHPSALEVGTRVSRLGNRSFDFESAIFAPRAETSGVETSGEDAPLAIARATCVWYDYRADRSVPIPQRERRIIQQFEEIES